MQASDALAQQVDARLNAGPSADGLLDTLGRIDQEVADSIADDFGGNLYVMSQEQEQLARIAADKTANAIFKYNAMSAQTQKDIAAIEQRSRESALILASMRERGNDAFERGVAEGIYKVRQSKAAADASFSGFRGDLMTHEDWGKTISAHTQKWAQDDTSKLFEIGSYMIGGGALLQGGIKLMGAGAFQFAQSGFRGAFISGSSKTAAVWGATKGGAQLYTGYQVADAGLGMLTDPSGTAAAVRQGIQTGQHIYHEGVRNGGFTYATGVTGELDLGTKVNIALGGYLAVDLKTMNFNYGGYGTFEGGSNLGLPNPTASLGWEHTVFTDSNYLGALTGKYSIHGAGDNYRNSERAITAAYISANDGSINGYQFTAELKNASVKTGFVRDPQAYTNFGYGAIYDSKLGLVGADPLKEFLQELLGD